MTNILFSVIIYIYIIFFIISISKYKNITLSNTINNHYTEDFEKIFSELTVSFTYSNNMLGKNKPKLSIDINPSTGNEGLDAEKEWRKKSAYCEHDDYFIYEGDKNDNTDPMLCDFSGDHEDTKDQSIAEQYSKPIKHRAIEHEGDWAYVCNNCFAVKCKDCFVDYPSEENTPVYSSHAEKYEEYKDIKQQNSSVEQTTFTEQNIKQQSNSSDKSSNNNDNKSLIDDFANTNCEMPDYTSGDD